MFYILPQSGKYLCICCVLPQSGKYLCTCSVLPQSWSCTHAYLLHSQSLKTAHMHMFFTLTVWKLFMLLFGRPSWSIKSSRALSLLAYRHVGSQAQIWCTQAAARWILSGTLTGDGSCTLYLLTALCFVFLWRGLAPGAMRIGKLLLFALSLSTSLHLPPQLQVQGKPR